VSKGGIGKAFASGIPLLHQPSHPENPALAHQSAEIIGQPVRTATSVPIASNSLEAFGTITWAITDDEREYHHEDVHAAEEVGAKFGHYLEENQTRESLARAVRAREGFMKAAGHELRTPLVSIKGYTQLLLRDFRRQTISPQRLESGLKAIDTATSRLTDLMEDLFSVANPGINSLPLRLVTVDLTTYVREFLTTTPSLTLAGHRIHLSEPDEPLMVQIDLTRLSQVLFNVTINAVHFSPADSDILITTRRNGDAAEVLIQDRGRGLAPGEETSIFDPFAQGRTSYGPEEQGLGIGLYISKQIVARHHGDIWAESVGLEQGTTFYIRLPLAPKNGDERTGFSAGF
jgi:signal transduction histidine kinase